MNSKEIDSSMRKVLRRVFVNMPWNYLGQFMDLVVENRMNLELGFSAADLERCSSAEVFSAVSRVRERGGEISFHGPFWDLSSGSIDPEIRKVVEARLDSLFRLVEAVRPRQVVLHTGFDPKHHRGQRREWVENSMATFEPFVRRAERANCVLVLENVFEEGPEFHIELMEKINSPCLGFCLDSGHQHSFSQTSLDKWLQATWPHLKEVHLHDNDSSSDAHLPVGSGTIDFDRLFAFLIEKRIAPLLTVEPHTVEHLYATLAGLARLASFNELLDSGFYPKGGLDGDR